MSYQHQPLPRKLTAKALALAATLGLLASTLVMASVLTTTSSSASAQSIYSPAIQNNESNSQIIQLGQAGNSASQILTAIYPNTTLTNTGTNWLRVDLGSATTSDFTPEGLNRVTIDDQTLFRATANTPISIGLQNNRWIIENQGRNLCPANGCEGDIVRVLFATATSVRVGATGQSYYHGRFSLTKNDSDNYQIVLDSIRLEDYLKGLNVAIWDWPAETLKARAIEARSYILAQNGARATDSSWVKPFEIHSSTPDLPYQGDAVELNASASPWLAAIDATAGQVLANGSGTAATTTTAPPATTTGTPTPATATPSPATNQGGAPGSFTFSGRGWGHGVGMSQYGALGRAAAGHNYQQILNFYYPGTSLGTQRFPITDLRVYLTSARSTTFTPRSNGQVYLDGQPLSAVSPGSRISVRLSGNAWHISVGGVGVCPAQGCAANRVYVAFASNSSIHVGATGRSYAHGRITLAKKSASEYYIVLDSITMEDYLLGIAEMPSDWHLEALKVQAVAARSYAYSVLYDRRTRDNWILPFDIYANTQDQFYVGDTREKSPYASGWLKAVGDTANQVLLHNGNYVLAHYSSSNGGYVSTDTFRSAANRKPYLQPVPDRFDSYTNPYSTWRVTYTNSQLSGWLNNYNDTYIGTLRSIAISNQNDPSGRINTATVTLTGSQGVKTVSGSRFFAVVNAGSIRHFNGYSRTLRSTFLAVGTSYPPLSTSAPTPSQPTPQPDEGDSQPIPNNPQPVTPTQQQIEVELAGTLDVLRYQNGVLYATGTAVATPGSDLTIEFLIDENTVKAGTLNRRETIEVGPEQSVTGNYGFSNALNVSRGPHSVCLFVSDGETRELSDCQLVGMVPQAPRGSFDAIEVTETNTVVLSGWAYDIDNIEEPVRVRISTRRLPSNASSSLPSTKADQERADLKDSVNELAAQSAWEYEVADLEAGTHEFCARAYDTSRTNSKSSSLGCQRVTIS